MNLTTIFMIALCYVTLYNIPTSGFSFNVDDFHDTTSMEKVYNYLKGKGYLLEEIMWDIGPAGSGVNMDDFPEFYELIDILDDEDDNSTEPVCTSCRVS